MDDGDFPAGSMGPKIESAVHFASNGGTAVITDTEHMTDALSGRGGLFVVRDADGPSRVAPAPAAA